MSGVSLYLIEILHQTTTLRILLLHASWLYLIEILHQTTTWETLLLQVLSLYLIEILHQTTTQSTVDRNAAALYLIEILHQTTTITRFVLLFESCILSKFYIKPQLPRQEANYCRVVSYRNSTSNHNFILSRGLWRIVVSYRNSTSNHNYCPLNYKRVWLYLIEILHQTTTSGLILIDKVLLTGCLPL